MARTRGFAALGLRRGTSGALLVAALAVFPAMAPASASSPLDALSTVLISSLEALKDDIQAEIDDCLDNGGCTPEEVAAYEKLLKDVMDAKAKTAYVG